jgi:arylsulfatase A-like enzyme
MALTRRDLVGTIAVAAAAPRLWAAPPKPNIVFILADDLGYADLGCYGQKEIRTPNIDRLAGEGLRFTQAYAGSTVCAPSRCSLMTGMHMGHARVRGNIEPQLPLRASDRTVAELLHEAGYRTGMFGKWGLGPPYSTGVPGKKGFDEFYGYLDQVHAHNYWTDTLWDNEEQVWLQGNFGAQKKVYSSDAITARALKFLDAVSADNPFFLYCPTTIPHSRWDPPSDAPYTNENWPQQKKDIAAMITKLDSDVGRIMETLKKRGLDRNTLVIFASDNGPVKRGEELFDSNGPFRGIKRDLYEGGIRIPFIARWTGQIKPGSTTDQPVTFWDFLPTAAELAGVAAPSGIDGISFVPTLTGGKQTPHEYLYWEFYERGFSQAVRVADWKAIRNSSGGPLELYNIRTDPSEQNNVASSHPDVMRKMEDTLKKCRTESDIWKPGQKPKPGGRISA